MVGGPSGQDSKNLYNKTSRSQSLLVLIVESGFSGSSPCVARQCLIDVSQPAVLLGKGFILLSQCKCFALFLAAVIVVYRCNAGCDLYQFDYNHEFASNKIIGSYVYADEFIPQSIVGAADERE